ncbi:rhodopsin-like [Babylonia areolata]|uniref:rhodopsin-like n=1 Tax=Babylonia areolata TaxID=304850 RepID=UPI003FD39CC7
MNTVVTTAVVDTTTSTMSNITHIYDTYDLFIHPHWKQFPLVPDVWHYAIGVFITFVGISGTLGNLLVIYIFGTTKTLRSPSNMYVVNLAISDLTFSAVNGFPLLTISAFNKRWIFGKIACELYGLVGGVFGLLSINTMAVIAIDRYNVIAKPIKAARTLSYHKAFVMIVLVWVWSITWTLPPLFGWGAYIPEGFQTSCTFDYLTRTDYFRSYIMCLYICGFAVPLGAIVFCYFFIYRTVARHEKEMGKMAKKLNAEIRQSQAQQKAEIKTAKIAMTIIVTYLLSWMPYATVALVAQFGPAHYVTPYVSELPVMFAKASAMHNPIIYALSHPRFREVLNTRFPWLLCCCRYSQKESDSVADTNRSKVSRVDSVNSNAPGGAVSNVSSEVSDLSDSAYTSNPGEAGGERHVSLRMKKMDGQAEAGVAAGGKSNGALIGELLQAFVGMASAHVSRQVPVIIPPQFLAQYGAQLPPAAQQAIYAISQGAVPANVLPHPPPPAPPVSRSVSQPGTPQMAPAAAAPESDERLPVTEDGPSATTCPEANQVTTTEAQVYPHVNEAYQED